ncbi:MAG: hypothetical protein ACI8RD_005884, partial [Bacillariaceae sp.]
SMEHGARSKEQIRSKHNNHQPNTTMHNTIL